MSNRYEVRVPVGESTCLEVLANLARLKCHFERVVLGDEFSRIIVCLSPFGSFPWGEEDLSINDVLPEGTIAMELPDSDPSP